MNAMSEKPEPGQEPEIILIGLRGSDYYLLKGDNHLNQLLLDGGEFPKPVLLVNFEDIFGAKQTLGKDFNVASLWGVNPAIVERLRTNKWLIEKNG